VRTAIISDIHSNLAALEAVLADIDQRNCQRIICLGDIIGYGPDPVACADLVAQRCEWSLLGNHDFGVLYEPTNFNSAAEQAAYWTREQFEKASKEDPEAGRRRWNFLGHLRVRVSDNGYLCVHGTPRKPINEYLFPDDAINNPHKLGSIFDRIDRVCFVGHTHVPGVFTDDSEFWKPDELTGNSYPVDPVQKAIINPGSVGQPRDGDPRASYAILDTGDGTSKHTIEFFRLPYEVDLTVDKIHAIPELHDWLGDRLREGR
jgi:diadenosine tetraphosphatase ApaH/serine/threonine PP2A family protein phosphatase